VAIPRFRATRSDSSERTHLLIEKGSSRRLRINLALAAALAALTLAVYAPVSGFAFLNYDDNVYVVDNARVSQGLTAGNAAWSLTAFENGNWHPLTLLSHMLDVQLFGLGLLVESTAQPWLSALVAALFAVHPLNVQTVAWISERKSLLSTAFWLLALIAYARDRRNPDVKTRALVVALSAMALASKPMAVSIPLTFVLFDMWPLRVRGMSRVLVPVTALAAVCGVLTVLAQRAADAIQPAASYPLPMRLANAAVSYAWYLKKTIWPSGLAAFYPHPLSGLAPAEVAASVAVLVVIAGAIVARGRAFRPLSMGFWWYAGTLLPVAGIIQVGSQARADRYAYVPLIGIFVAIVWSVAAAAGAKPRFWKTLAAIAAASWIGGLSLVTRAQLPYWHDSVSLFQRAIDVVPDNPLAHNNLGMALVENGRLADALPHFQTAVELAPDDTDARSNLGNALRTLGRPADAVLEYRKALDQSPADPTIHYNLATALLDLGRTSEAVAQLEEAVRLNPSYAKAKALLERIEARNRR
jgi:hypothetical protein